MTSADDFIRLVRSNGADMDDQLIKMYNQNARDYYMKGYVKAESIHQRLRIFSKKQSGKFWEEFSELRERVAKLGYFGVYLDDMCLYLYTKEIDPVPFVTNYLKEKAERQANYANQPKKTPQEDNQVSLFKDGESTNLKLE